MQNEAAVHGMVVLIIAMALLVEFFVTMALTHPHVCVKAHLVILNLGLVKIVVAMRVMQVILTNNHITINQNYRVASRLPPHDLDGSRDAAPFLLPLNLYCFLGKTIRIRV